MKKIKLLAIILAIASILTFAACGGDTSDATTPKNDTPDTPSVKEPAHNLAEYSIVYSNKANYLSTEAAASLAGAISDFRNENLIPSIDSITETGAKEILIGDTNRPESAEALALVTNENTFVIKSIGDKIVINAKNDKILPSAINAFFKLAFENKFVFEEKLEIVSEPVELVEIFNNSNTDFEIHYPAELDDVAGADDRRDFEAQTAFNMQADITTLYGKKLTLKKEAATDGKVILIGYCANEKSVKFHQSLGLDEYGFEVIGNTIVISGTNTTTTRQAVSLFLDIIKSQGTVSGKSISVSLYDGLRVTRRAGTWNTDLPDYEGGTFFGTLNAANKAFGICYENTTAEEFEAYCEKLESEGYELWQRHDIEDNLHATYTHNTRGLVHVYFTGNEENVRIITYRAGTYNLPTHPTKETYQSVTKTAITQYGLDRSGGSVGMGYVITLEDGSFIVIDGGSTNDAGNMQKQFYELLKSLNKRPDGKIVIRAWYLTHEHGDHYQNFRAFMKDYGKNVIIEEFWCNPSSRDYAYHGDHSAFGTAESNYKTYKTQVNGDFKWINLHTGMEFYAVNMKFEVLYTEEDYFPRTLSSGNDTCLVMKMTDQRSGQVTLWMGDTLLRGCKVLSEKYDGYLKTDILQVAHHGKSEALPVYQQALPTVALWSCRTSQKNSQTTGSSYKIYWDTNVFLRDNVPVHITSDSTYTIYLPYKQGDKIYEWKK